MCRRTVKEKIDTNESDTQKCSLGFVAVTQFGFEQRSQLFQRLQRHNWIRHSRDEPYNYQMSQDRQWPVSQQTRQC